MTTTQIENMVRTMCPTFSESQLALVQSIAKLFFEAGCVEGRKAVLEIEDEVLATA